MFMDPNKWMGHPTKAPSIIQVDWIPPLGGWIKVNTDGAAKGSPGHAGGGGIFRDKSGAVLGCFADYYGITDSIHAEFCAAMFALEMAYEKGWNHLWLECDSSFVVQAFSSPELVPWRIRNRWRNCLILSSFMRFKITHIYSEGNNYADKLASFGIDSKCYTRWDLIPSFIRTNIFRNRFGLPNYRFR